MKILKKIGIYVAVFLLIVGSAFMLGTYYQAQKTKKIVYVDFISEEIETEQENIHKYKFLPAELSAYIVRIKVG